ncbi:unnamed protein product [Chrysodeixis includens]|uniref:Transmembrane protein n=1 Tax=Chrysodeixis includens TaxID=689277 RepID=A0A9N8KZZ1_CHRIL|nr:unnamed protein product [Chrysodeixis includens]
MLAFSPSQRNPLKSKSVEVGLLYCLFAPEARTSECGANGTGILERRKGILASVFRKASKNVGPAPDLRVGLPSHRAMRVTEQRVHLCMRTRLCTIICPAWLAGVIVTLATVAKIAQDNDSWENLEDVFAQQ